MFKLRIYIVAIFISLVSTLPVQAKNPENGFINKLVINYDKMEALELNISQNDKKYTGFKINDIRIAEKYTRKTNGTVDLTKYLVIPKLYDIDKFSSYIFKFGAEEYHVSSHATQEGVENYFIPFNTLHYKETDIHHVVYFNDGEYKEYEIHTVKHKKENYDATRYLSDQETFYNELWSNKKPYDELGNDFIYANLISNTTYEIKENKITINNSINKYDLAIYINDQNKYLLKNQETVTLDIKSET